MALTIDDVKLYLRIDGTDEDGLLERLLGVAEAYLDGAVDNFSANMSDERFAAKAEMVEQAIIADLYENRNTGGIESHQYGRAVESMIRQLQLWTGGGPDD